MTISQFRQLAAYNRWANARLYAAALDLSDRAYRLDIGVSFGSLHGTLNYLLLTDRLWLRRLTGEGDQPDRLDAILYEDRVELTQARIDEDNRLMAVVDQYDETTLANLHGYKTTSGMPQSQVLADILWHLFHHQTHHRGQAHACLSILTGGEPPSLDLLVFQRGGTCPDLKTLIRRVERIVCRCVANFQLCSAPSLPPAWDNVPPRALFSLRQSVFEFSTDFAGSV